MPGAFLCTQDMSLLPAIAMWPGAGLGLSRRHRRLGSIGPTLSRRLVFAGLCCAPLPLIEIFHSSHHFEVRC